MVYSKEFNDKFHLNDFHLSLKDASLADHKPLRGKVLLPTVPGDEATGRLARGCASSCWASLRPRAHRYVTVC